MPKRIPTAPAVLRIYDALPPDARHALLHNNIGPLLDAAPHDRQRRLLAFALQLQRRHTRAPPLNLDAKKAEITALLLELSRDSKRSIIRERSRKDLLISEAVDSITRWLNDIWKVVFEHRTNFSVAHACLLFACDALDQIGTGCGGCKCSYASMFIPLKITRSTGKVVKSFTLNGVQNLEIAMLWIWRDLFMIILATGSRHQRCAVPKMIRDIRVLLGWRALEQLLRGGTKSVIGDDPNNLGQDCDPGPSSGQSSIVDDDDDQNYVSDDCSSECDDSPHPGCLYATHWSWRITDQQSRLRDLIHNALLEIFKVAPSGALYSSMMSITDDECDLEEELHPVLMSVAGHSSENLSAALRILSLKNCPNSVYELVQSYKHLLRPQDAASLQLAVLIMSSDQFYRDNAVAIAEEELLDVAKEFHAAVRLYFSSIDSEIHKAELAQIITLRRDTFGRRTRVERWVKGVLTPQVSGHPMALAAFMMGIQLPPGAEGPDEGDMLGYFEVDGDDSELEDLREEFRPNIKSRFQGWVDAMVAIKGGPAILSRIYAKVIVDMPFLKASDIVDEMSARIADRPSKQHVCDALGAIKEFCEKQRTRLTAKDKGKGKAIPADTDATAGASTSRDTSTGTDTTSSSHASVFGMEVALEEMNPEAVIKRPMGDPNMDLDLD